MTTLGSGNCAACHHGRRDHGEDGTGPCEAGRCICNGFFLAGAGHCDNPKCPSPACRDGRGAPPKETTE
jgi:hypothetical protein